MISTQQIYDEYIKCSLDKTRIYMIENYLKTYDGTQEMEVSFKLFPKQKEFLENLTNYSNNITLKPRQTGYSTVTCARIACELVLASNESPQKALIVANQSKMSRDDLSKVKEFITSLPRWFFGNEYYSPDEKSEKNTKDIFERATVEELFLVNGSKLYARSSGKDATRGISAVHWLFFDETAFIDDGINVASAAIKTTGSVKNKHIIMVSTPNGKDALYYEYYNNAVQKKNNYHITELRWYHDPRFNKNLRWWREKIITDEDGKEIKDKEWQDEETIDIHGNIKYEPEKWKELEKQGWKAISPWYIDACNEVNNDKQKIAQELECSFLGSDSIAVDPAIINMQRELNVRDVEGEDYLVDPIHPETWIWKPPIEGHRYIMCIDGSRGDAGDNASIEIIDIDAIDENNIPYIDQVLEWEGKLAGDIVGEIAYGYGLTYNNAFAIVDCQGGWGQASVLTLLRMNYPNLYYDDIRGKDFLMNLNDKLKPRDDGKLPGFHARGTREFQIEIFISKLRDNVLKIRSTRVISQLETWVVKASGKIEHKEGKHDDALTNLAMALFVYSNTYLTLERQKEQDIVRLNAWISYLKNSSSTVSQPKSYMNMNPQKYDANKIYTSKNLNQNKYPFMWLFGKDLKK